MRKIYNQVFVFLVLVMSSSASFGSSAARADWNYKSFGSFGPGVPSVQTLQTHQALQYLHKPSLKYADTVHLRTSNLKDNRPKPYLIFSAPTFNITHKLMLGAGSTAALAYNKIESQYQVTFGNFSVNSPIHDQLTLSYSLSRDTKVTAQIFTVLGTEVTTLFSEYQLAGPYRMVRSLADRVSSGIYILKLTAGNEQMAKRIQVL